MVAAKAPASKMQVGGFRSMIGPGRAFMPATITLTAADGHTLPAYHAMPDGRKPPAPPVGFLGSKGPSMLQSCGTLSRRHAESPKPTVSAFAASPLKKRQSASKEVEILGDDAANIGSTNAAAIRSTAEQVVFSIISKCINKVFE